MFFFLILEILKIFCFAKNIKKLVLDLNLLFLNNINKEKIMKN